MHSIYLSFSLKIRPTNVIQPVTPIIEMMYLRSEKLYPYSDISPDIEFKEKYLINFFIYIHNPLFAEFVYNSFWYFFIGERAILIYYCTLVVSVFT